MGVVRGSQGAEDIIQGMEENAFGAAPAPLISLDEANEVVNVDVPVGQWLLVERRVTVMGGLEAQRRGGAVRRGGRPPRGLGSRSGDGRLGRVVEAVRRSPPVDVSVGQVGDSLGGSAEIRWGLLPPHGQRQRQRDELPLPGPRWEQHGEAGDIDIPHPDPVEAV